jgi:hypothetical protein
MAVVNFVTGNGIGFILRFLTTHLERWSGSSWGIVGNALFTGGTTNYFTYTAFSNGVDGLYEYAPMDGSLTLIEGGPSALHLSTFGGRVLASGPDGELGTLQWSAKNDSRDWTGIGSGQEPLLSTPGGKVDALMGVWPVTDDFALMVRSGSIWQMSQTGDPDAPYRFGRLHANVGSRSRHSIDSIPGGIIMLGIDDIWIVTDSEISPIGQLVRDRIFLENDDVTQACGRYRPDTKEYWLIGSNTDIVYRWSFEDKGWTRHRYSFDIRWLERSAFHYEGIRWDDVVGTWDAQTGRWDSFLGATNDPQFLMASSDNFVVKESATRTDDELISTGKSVQGIEIQTPVLEAASPFEKTEIIECQIEYEQGVASQAVTIEYSTDGGTTWVAYSSKTLALTNSYPQIKRAMKTLERKAMQLRLTSPVLGQLTLVSFTPFLVVGAKKEP